MFDPKQTVSAIHAETVDVKYRGSLYAAEVMALFDHVIESAKIGLRKPDCAFTA